jgi:hypothetical protein
MPNRTLCAADVDLRSVRFALLTEKQIFDRSILGSVA